MCYSGKACTPVTDKNMTETRTCEKQKQTAQAGTWDFTGLSNYILMEQKP
jgi:hypothetical protein